MHPFQITEAEIRNYVRKVKNGMLHAIVIDLSFWSWIMTLNYDPELQAAKLPMAHGRDAVEVADGAAEDGGSVLPGKEPVEVVLDGLTVGN